MTGQPEPQPSRPYSCGNGCRVPGIGDGFAVTEPQETQHEPARPSRPDIETSTTGRHSTIAHKVGEQLRRSSYLALRDVSCSTSDGEVCLMGFLPSYYLEQVAQEIALGVEGVRHVVNRIKVFPTYAGRGEALANNEAI